LKEKKMLRDYALKAWEMEKEKRKQSDFKKRKRRAKKIEEEIYDLLPKDAEDYDFERDLENTRYAAVVSLTEGGQTLRFTFDDEDDLTLIGECSRCRQEAVSKAVTSAAELGQMIEAFEPSDSHNCPTKKPIKA
jgi:hypothetical protein